MSDIDQAIKYLQETIKSKFWDYPSTPDEMKITSYDAFDNPTIIEFYKQGKLMFTHYLTYDGSGRLTDKKLVRA
jgi:hypothetical protein